MVDDSAAMSLNLAAAVCAAVYEGLRQLANLPPGPAWASSGPDYSADAGGIRITT